ncbi:MAG: hypothetical protein LW832_06040 [Parachlamydia sp.]|nr:hypothetical protein [Parachlamydia sp.]
MLKISFILAALVFSGLQAEEQPEKGASFLCDSSEDKSEQGVLLEKEQPVDFFACKNCD